MPSNHDLLAHMAKLAAFEQELWKAFRAAEKKAHIGVLNLPKQFKVQKILPNTTRWFVRNHPYFLVCTAFGALATLLLPSFLQPVGLIFYGAAFAAAMASRDPFRAAHAMKVLGTTNVTDRAFGLDNLSLSVYETVSNSVTLTADKKKDLASVIKIVKSSHEYLNTGYGYYDHLKKFIVGGIVALPVTVILLVYQNWTALPGALKTAQQFVLANGLIAPKPIAFALFYGAAISILLYFLVYGDQRLERQKKRYLLTLNIVHESWQ